MENTIGTVLFTQEQILERAREIGKQIDEDFAGEEVLLVGTLKGSCVWMADIMKNVTLDTAIDFVIAGSYGSNTTTSGVVTIKKDIETNISGKNVIIIEDIVDSGTTLKYLLKHFGDMKPKSLKVCTLLDKPSRRVADIPIDYRGFEVENLFIIGYGLDYDQKYRNLPYVSYLQG